MNAYLMIYSLLHHRIAKLDKRIGTCTVLASNKWQPIYEECETALGFSGNAASDVLTAWTRIASNAYEQRQLQLQPLSNSTGSSNFLSVANPLRRVRSLSILQPAPPGKINHASKTTVRAPGELISLARARAQTIHERSYEETGETEYDFGDAARRSSSMLNLEMSMRELEKSLRLSSGQKITISGPLHLKEEEEEVPASYLPLSSLDSMYSPRSDNSPISTSGRYFPSHQGEEEAGVHRDSLEESAEKTLEAGDIERREPEMRQSNISFEQQRSAARQFDAATAIQRYIDKVKRVSTHSLEIYSAPSFSSQAFNTPTHPLGVMMNRLEGVFRDSYGGIGANKFLLPHAIAEVQYICKRLHGIIRYIHACTCIR